MRYIRVGFLILIVASLCWLLSGCAGSGTIWEYEVNDKGELELKRITEFEGRNIKAKTEKGAEVETKNLELPSVPFKL